ncbi:MAG: BBP7 family outer membrane beta-barrel protein [Parachlamydiaceae bacterium]|nr:MAG: BBP7 family outer membrane beta-barrel protein [Parachlamydiaceae bacterium]
MFCPENSVSYWINAEYLYWKIKDQPVDAPFVTSASYADTIPGAIGQPHTHVLIGNENIKMNWQPGFLLSAGLPINVRFNLEASYFLLPKTSKEKSLMTSGEPGSSNFAVPVFDITGFGDSMEFLAKLSFCYPVHLMGNQVFLLNLI